MKQEQEQLNDVKCVSGGRFPAKVVRRGNSAKMCVNGRFESKNLQRMGGLS